ncbi:MAG TPA: DUF1028 domain-containing protein [Thermoplasmata archaeon]|nr:DUF1028 domain-containing protein [Thermoplasmata archaeon]
MHDPRDRGTFSIVACDDERKYWGVAVATKPASVGALVPWGEWRVGAIATQAWYNYFYGPRGLDLLRRGLTAEEVVRRLTRSDPGRELRQLGVVDRRGRAAAWTGSKCMEFALHQTGDGYTCQGNLLASASVVPAMAKAFESAGGTLGSRMLRALKAGAREGGDRRGMESAALMVYHRERWTPWHTPDFWANLRVDRHRRPIAELERLVRLDEAETRGYLAQRAAAARKRKKGRS